MYISPVLFAFAALGWSAIGEAKRPCVCSNRALEQCLRAKGVPFKVSCDSDWADYSRSTNLRLPIKPVVVVVPRNTKQVSSAVICADRGGVKVQAKSGGQSYGSFGFGGVDGEAVIDLRHFNQTVLTANNVAVVGGGSRLGPMATSVHAQGNRAISHGICPSVGIGGHSTHGGWGYTSRSWGVTLDHILEMQVVLANGTEAKASPDTNPDLYWAMRGAADSIGIAVSFSLRTQEAPSEMVNLFYEFRTVTDTVDQAVDAFSKLQTFIANSSVVDRRLSFALQTHVNIDYETGDVNRALVIEGSFMGSLAEYERDIEPEMMRGLPPPTGRDVTANDWVASLARLSPDRTVTGTTLYLNYYANSVTIDDPGMNEASIRSYFTYMIEGPAPPASYLSSMELWGGADSQINLSGKDTSFAAFPHRSVFWTAHNIARSGPLDETFPAEGIVYMNGLRQSIIENLGFPTRAYMNLIDTTLTRDQAHAVYYGDEVLQRLKGVKAKYDPKNLFSNPQSVEP